MESSFSIGRIAGIKIGIHYTWLIVFGLVSWSLAAEYFPRSFPGWTVVTYWAVGVLSALALFASVLIHELSHSLVARARGVSVDSITLFIFGGVSNLKTESEEPQDEFLISIVGPLTSFLLAALFYAARQALAPGRSALGASIEYLSLINVLLGIFNLLPGFPLDGGRVLRSVVWGVTKDLQTATNVASVVGQGLGFLMIFWGVSQIFSGFFFNGLWIAFIGWFLNNAAEASRQQQRVRENLRGVTVAALMQRDVPIVPLDMSVRDFVFDHVLGRGERAALLEDDQVLGIASVTDAKKVPREEWATTSLREVMTPAPLKTIAPNEALSKALELLAEGELNQLPVVQDGHAVGMLSRADVLRYLQLRDELGVNPRAAGGKQRPANRVNSPAERESYRKDTNEEANETLSQPSIPTASKH
jgi:Zn-dependent protease/CBS domain-containing protein